ncbi:MULTISPECIES: ABC transporter ATP-binding protein [unclassified Nocardiopsis]|uniref:ABC transporter ATP-binding protein n=1 Tax=Nocardiopsis TaxID=2013 RepID=UPI00387B03D7
MIEVENLSKHYGRTRAVDDLTFTAPSGKVTGFLGPNGAGKSTTMRMIVGLDRPTGGRAGIDGVRYRDLPSPLRTVGAVLDTGGVPRGMTAAAHLRWVAAAARLPDRRVDEVLGTVGLSDVAGKRVGGFSLGMRQRLGIATALLGDPGTLLLDEPVNGLDPEGVRWVRTLMRSLAAEGRTVLVSSHLMGEMAETADRVVVIGRGRLIADTTVADLVHRGAGGRVRVSGPRQESLAAVLRDHGCTVETGTTADDTSGTPALVVTGAEAADIGDLAARYGLALHELTAQRPSLEDVFMEITGDSAGHVFAPATTVAGGEK